MQWGAGRAAERGARMSPVEPLSTPLPTDTLARRKAAPVAPGGLDAVAKLRRFAAPVAPGGLDAGNRGRLLRQRNRRRNRRRLLRLAAWTPLRSCVMDAQAGPGFAVIDRGHGSSTPHGPGKRAKSETPYDFHVLLWAEMFSTCQKTQELWMWKMEYLHHEQRPLYFGEWF